MRLLRPGLAMTIWGFCAAPCLDLQAKVLLSQKEALQIAFPGSKALERKTVFLTEKQVEAIQKIAQAKLESKIITYYVGRSSQSLMGYAFFETHNVRTMPETFMAVVRPEGTLQLVEMLAFYEPEDYLPPKKWMGLFKGKGLDNELWAKRGIRNIAGATLSAQAITDGIRRILAIFEIAIKKEKSR